MTSPLRSTARGDKIDDVVRDAVMMGAATIQPDISSKLALVDQNQLSALGFHGNVDPDACSKRGSPGTGRENDVVGVDLFAAGEGGAPDRSVRALQQGGDRRVLADSDS